MNSHHSACTAWTRIWRQLIRTEYWAYWAVLRQALKLGGFLLGVQKTACWPRMMTFEQDTCLYCGETSKVDTAIPVRGQLKIGQKIPVAEVGAFTRAGLHPTCQANMCFHRVYVPVLHAASSPHTLLLICGLPDVIKQSDFSTAAHQWDIARHSFGLTALCQRGTRLSVCSA